MSRAPRDSTPSQAGEMTHNTHPTSSRTTHDIVPRPEYDATQSQWGDLTSRIEHWRRSIPGEQRDPRVHHTGTNAGAIDMTRSAQGRLHINPPGTVAQEKEPHTRSGLSEQEKISKLGISGAHTISRRPSSRSAFKLIFNQYDPRVTQENDKVSSQELKKAKSQPDEKQKEVDKSETEISSDDDFDESV